MSIYKLTSQRLTGHIEIQFAEGSLNVVKMALNSPLNEVQFRALMTALPQYEIDLPKLESLGLTAQAELPTNEKIALFCRMYKKYKGVRYNVHPADTGKIKLIKLDEEILQFYFNSSNFLFKDKHSISNLVKYYNELLAEIATATKPKTVSHPDYFDQAYQNKLTTKELPGYWSHLRDLGFIPKKNERTGEVTDWIKA